MATGIHFDIARHDGVAEIIFTDAPTRNSLNRATRVALVDELRTLEVDEQIRAIIITGRDPAFSSGVNAKEFLGNADYEPPATNPAVMLRSMMTPTIAAVNGICVSGALEIALACSLIVASEHAQFADTHARLGITPGWGLSSELPAAIGPARARQMSLTAQKIDAETALTWGLVNEVLPHLDLLPRAREIAAEISAIPVADVERAMELSLRGQLDLLGAARERERQMTAARKQQ
jgi:enoyl-CoA hydratase